ncbi:MAG: serine protease, partial [Paludibacter sp.]|nr:serine protease [Paludibacter sp.]
SHSGGVSHFFSIRNLVNFMLGTGWSGICFYKTIPSKLLLMFVAIFCGIFFLFIFFFLVKILLKLSKDNTFHLNETLDKIADVYLFIPANESGKGKIQISVRGSVHEIDALTKGERISTDEKVRVIQIIGNQAILV